MEIKIITETAARFLGWLIGMAMASTLICYVGLWSLNKLGWLGHLMTSVLP